MEIAIIIAFFTLIFWLRSISIRLFKGKEEADKYLDRSANRFHGCMISILIGIAVLIIAVLTLVDV